MENLIPGKKIKRFEQQLFASKFYILDENAEPILHIQFSDTGVGNC